MIPPEIEHELRRQLKAKKAVWQQEAERAGYERARAEFDGMLTRFAALKSLNGSTEAFVKAFVESEHPRDHGKFASSQGSSEMQATGSKDARGKARSLASRIKEVPQQLRDKVTAFVKTKYDKLAARYGPTGAKAVLGAAILLTPVPLPGTTLIPVALAEAVLAITNAVKGIGKAGMPLGDDEVNELAQQFLSELSGEVDDTIPGGKGDNTDPATLPADQLAKGERVEREHTDSPALAREIATDHLTERPDYYDRLQEMESKPVAGDLSLVAEAMLAYAEECAGNGTDPAEGLERLRQRATGDGDTVAKAAKFSCVYAPLVGGARDRLLLLGRMVIDEDLSDDKREEDPHVTVFYGLHTDDVDDVEPLLSGVGPVNVRLGAVSLFRGEDSGKPYDVIKVDVDSADLVDLNLRLRSLPHTLTHAEYRPHATIAYVKAGLGEKYAVAMSSLNMDVSIDTFVFSDVTRQKQDIRLTYDPVRKAWDNDEHPRDDHGRFVSKDAIHAAKGDPAKAAELRDRVTDPEQRAKLDAALEGKADLGRTKRGEQRERAAVSRLTREEARQQTNELIRQFSDAAAKPGAAPPVTNGDLEAMARHLPSMTVAELRRARMAMRASFKGGRKRDEMVAALVEHARGQKVEEKQKKPRAPMRDTGSLYSWIATNGGVNPDDPVLGRFKDAVGDGISMGIFKRGGRFLDDLASELAENGDIVIPEGETPDEYLFEQLKRGAMSRNADMTKEYERANNDYWRERQAAESEHTAAEIESVVRSSEAAADIAEASGAHESLSGEPGDASEAGLDDADTSFDFGGDAPPSEPPVAGGPEAGSGVPAEKQKEPHEMTAAEYQRNGLPNYGDMVSANGVVGTLRGGDSWGSGRAKIVDSSGRIHHINHSDAKLIRRQGIGSTDAPPQLDKEYTNSIKSDIAKLEDEHGPLLFKRRFVESVRNQVAKGKESQANLDKILANPSFAMTPEEEKKASDIEKQIADIKNRPLKWDGDTAGTHKQMVANALAAGKHVPPEVLADYPDLAPTTPPPAAPSPEPDPLDMASLHEVPAEAGPDAPSGPIDRWQNAPRRSIREAQVSASVRRGAGSQQPDAGGGAGAAADKPKVEYVRAKAGGEVSEVDGKFYAGGRMMPIHGKYSGMEKPPKGEGIGEGEASPPDPNSDGGGGGRNPARRLTPEEAEARRKELEDADKARDISDGPIGKMTKINSRTGMQHGVAGIGWRPWKEYAEQVGEDRLKQIVAALPPPSDPDDREHYDYQLNHPQGFLASASKAHLKRVPSSGLARHAVDEALRTAKTVDDVHRVHQLMTGSQQPEAKTPLTPAEPEKAGESVPTGGQVPGTGVPDAKTELRPDAVTPDQMRKYKDWLSANGFDPSQADDPSNHPRNRGYGVSQTRGGWVTPFGRGTYGTRQQAISAAREVLGDYAERKPYQPKEKPAPMPGLVSDINSAAQEQRDSGRIAKHNHERTQKEFIAREGKMWGGPEKAAEVHRRIIEGALNKGDTVPPEVLADYPDLAPAPSPAAVSPADVPAMAEVPAPSSGQPDAGAGSSQPAAGGGERGTHKWRDKPVQSANASSFGNYADGSKIQYGSNSEPIEGEIAGFPITTEGRGLLGKVSAKTKKAIEDMVNDPETLQAMKDAGIHTLYLRDNSSRNSPAGWTMAHADGVLHFNPQTAERIAKRDKIRGYTRGVAGVIYHEAGHGLWAKSDKSAREQFRSALAANPQVREEIAKQQNIKAPVDRFDGKSNADYGTEEVHAELNAIRKYNPERFAAYPKEVRDAVDRIAGKLAR